MFEAVQCDQATLISRLSSVVAINVLWNYDFELNLYPAQEEGLLYCQILHPETELQELTENKDCFRYLLLNIFAIKVRKYYGFY